MYSHDLIRRPQSPERAFLGQSRSYTNKASERVLRVLDAVAAGAASRGITELSQELGMTKNMVFRALATLMREGYVVRDRAGTRYQLGYRLFELRSAWFEEPDLRKVCAPFMRRMHDLTGETVTISMQVGLSSVVIDGLEGRNPVVSRVLYGRSIPLHAGPGSRAILAFLSDAELENFLFARSPLLRVTPTTIVDRKALREEVRLVRRRGYAVGYGDHIPDVWGVAFPVLDANGCAIGAIAVGAPGLKHGKRRLTPYIARLQEIMAELNERVEAVGASLPLSRAA